MINLDEEKLPEKIDGKYINNEVHTAVDIHAFDLDPSVVQLETEEDLDEKTISYIEKKLIRKSYEYRKYINYLKNELNLTKCSLLEGVDINTTSAGIEFHHYPLNLYEITDAVAKQKVNNLAEGEQVSCFEIAEEVMKEHYKNNIGLVPLSTTIHKMAHNKSILIPFTKIYGNYEGFMTKYNQYIDEDVKERVQLDKINNGSEQAREYNREKLSKKIVNFNIDYKGDAEDE